MAALGSPSSFYKRVSDTHQLESSPEWHHLLHYQHRVFGGFRSQVEGPAFFLSPDGKTSPQLELTATLEKFFDGPFAARATFQCAFLARRDFLIRNLEVDPSDLLPCPEFENWIQRLNPQKLTLVYASGSLHEPATSFGHVFLKIQSPDKGAERDLLNYGLNYAARTSNTTGALYAWYGLLGYFPGTYGMAPYHHLIKEYTHLEGRDLWEYELNLTPAEIIHLMKHLLELEKGSFDYYFIDENCARMIAVALDIARPGTGIADDPRPFSLPLQTVKRAVSHNFVTAHRVRNSLQTEFDQSYLRLSIAERLRLRKLIAMGRSSQCLDVPTFLTKTPTATLEAAQDYFSLRGAEDFRRYKEINYALASERSQRRALSTTASAEVHLRSNQALADPQVSPDQGADDSAIFLGLAQSRELRTAELQLRMIGHDLLDSPMGVAAFSEFELLQARFEFEEQEHVSLSEARIFNVLSTTPWSFIETPVSFGFTLGWEQVWFSRLRMGAAFELSPDARWMNFFTGRVSEPHLNEKTGATGFESLLAWHLQPHMRARLSVAVGFEEPWLEPKWSGGIAWDLSRDVELRLSSSSTTELDFRFAF